MKLSRPGHGDSDAGSNSIEDVIQDREEVSSLLHIGERDFSALRDRHRRLRQRIRNRDKEEATTTTTTSRPRQSFRDDEDDSFSSIRTSSFQSRGALLHRNRQDSISEDRKRQELIERLNRNRFETVDTSRQPPPRSRTPPQAQTSDDLEKQELLDKLNAFEREREELIRKLNQLEGGDDGVPSAPVRVTTKKPKKVLEPIVCRENNELHANPQSCRKYFKCENGLPSLQSCPANLIFDATINVCNWPGATECIEDPDAVLPTLGSSDHHPPSAAIFKRPPPPSSFSGDDDFFAPAPTAPTAPPAPAGRAPTLEEALEQEQKITDQYPYFRWVQNFIVFNP